MSGETVLWGQFKKVFGPTGHWVRVENTLGLGTPDVNGRSCGNGPDIWLELKYRKTWPKRARTLVRLKHFTVQQKQWLVNRGKVGGCCGVLWQVDRDYLLFGWWDAPYLGTLNKAELLDKALWRGQHLSVLLKRGIKIERN